MSIKFGEIKFIIIFSILIIFTGIVILYINSNYFSGDDFTDTLQLKATRFTPVLEAKITTGENLIYSSTFQVAWNNLCKDTLKGETAEIESPPDYIKTLNNKIYESSSISESSCVAISGTMKEDISDRIERAMAEKFGYIIKLKKLLKNDGIQVFSFLDKDIKLGNENIVEKSPSVFFVGTQHVDILYTIFNQGPKYAKTTELLYYDNYDVNIECWREFTFKLLTTSIDEELIFSTIPPEKTLKETYEKIVYYNSICSSKDKLITSAKYLIPELNIKLKNTITELSNKKILNNSFNNYEIIDSKQTICFKFVEGKLTNPDHSGIDFLYRVFIIRRPFFVYIRNKSCTYPYFMAYIANDELLSKKSYKDFMSEREEEKRKKKK